MRKSVLCPVLALCLGAVAALLRLWQRSAGYDAGGLPVPFALPSVVLTVFLLLCAGGALYLALSRPKVLEDQAAALPRGDLPAALLTAAGVLVLVGGALDLLAFFRSYLAYSQVLYASEPEQQEALRGFLTANLMTGATALASVPTAAALLLRARQARQGEEGVRPFAAMMPPIFCWLWLIREFRLHTSNPILWDYVLLLLAVVALLISTYERAGFAFGAGKPRRSVFTSLAALVLAVSALPDCGGVANAASLAAMAALTWTELTALLGSLEYAPEHPAPETPNETIQEEETSHEP